MTTTWRRLLLALLVAYPAILIIVATAQGIGVSIDSVSYIATAKSFAAGDGLLSYDGLPLTIFPPGYPLLLGVLMVFGISLNAAAVTVNVLAVGLLVLMAYVLSRRLLGSVNEALLVTAFVALSASTVRTNAFAWSEPVFSVLVLVVLLVLVRAFDRGMLNWASGGAVAVLTSAAVAFRFVGIALIPVVALGGYLTWRRACTRGQAAARTAVLVAGSLAGFIIVAVRNLALGSGPMGERYPGSRTIEGGLATAFGALGEAIAPAQTTSLTAFVGVVVVVLLFAGAWIALVRRNTPILVTAAFIAVYWAAIVVSQSTTRVDAAGERFAAPTFVPVVILAGYALRELACSATTQLSASGVLTAGRARLACRVLGAGAFVAVVGLSALHGLQFVRTARAEGLVGLGNSQSPLTLAVAARDIGVASNDPWSVWWARQAGPVVDLPVSPTEWPQARVDADVERLVDAVADGRVSQIAVFTDGRSYLPLDELRDFGLVLTELEQFDDGVIYNASLVR